MIFSWFNKANWPFDHFNHFYLPLYCMRVVAFGLTNAQQFFLFFFLLKRRKSRNKRNILSKSFKNGIYARKCVCRSHSVKLRKKGRK